MIGSAAWLNFLGEYMNIRESKTFCSAGPHTNKTFLPLLFKTPLLPVKNIQ